MKKFLLSFLLFFGSAVYVVAAPRNTGASTITAARDTAQTRMQEPETAVSATREKYKDGIYTGSRVNAYYGIVQVQISIRGGTLVDVTFLSYPDERNTSRYINSQAMPLLKQEAIQAQSAQVSGVSGASDTSATFKESLGAALAQAAP